MNQLIVLGVIALVLILRLRSVLGTRTGFEPDERAKQEMAKANAQGQNKFEVIDGGVDRDISDHVDIDSPAGKALAEIKRAEPAFSVTEFIGGAKQAYEMILMAFEGDDQETLSQFLSKDVFDGFTGVIDARQAQGLRVNAEFIGVRELKLLDAEFDSETKEAELTLQFVGELSSEVVDASGAVVEGDKNTVKRQKDIWTFARIVGAEDPNWQLVETGT
ncbi:preprotein translocase subunit Tim44 [Amylibacter marinus]|uniref:Preprotein translocase subunit Tim44 n=1 Tax=Amylibacter marinus TaxID=1475483 RepID=A0ABQ5VW11_9RHOB|nr:preprotein translocase subunit Tim44 [Amylibacter marinus]